MKPENSATMTPRTFARSFAPLLLAAVLLAGAVFPEPASAQTIKPWAPASDTLRQLTSSARVRFQKQSGDSATGPNYEAYDLVSQAARRLLRALGRDNVRQAPAIEGTLDSLGLDTEIAYDPLSPSVVFMLVRNPFKPGADAIGYLYWYRGNDLRVQGVGFPPSLNPRLRVWWTGRQEAPYEAGVLFDIKRGARQPAFKLFRMGSTGHFWNLIQYEGKGPHFEVNSEAQFADINRDGLPELLVFSHLQPDSTLEVASEAPGLVNELVYTERAEGFVLHDLRTLPGPVHTLFLFSDLLAKGQHERARQLLLKPEKLTEAISRGWGNDTRRGAWQVEYAEPNQAWPEWLALKVREKGGSKRWIFHFTIRDGRWIIRDWLPVVDTRPGTTPSPAPRDTTRARRGTPRK